MRTVSRVRHPALALETTLLVHGVPRDQSAAVAAELSALARARQVQPAFVGVVEGVPTVGLSDAELDLLLRQTEPVPKVNSANLGVIIHRRAQGATTVSATLELAASAGVRVFATGGLGGVHRNLSAGIDISADLGALARHPVALVTSGVKSLLDVEGTREILESLGVCVVGFGTDRFPAFYLRESSAPVDARFDDVAELAAFVEGELSRRGRAIVVAHPVPASEALDARQFGAWLEDSLADAKTSAITGRDVTPFVLARLHERSGGATLRSNLALIRSNVDLGARLVAAMGSRTRT